MTIQCYETEYQNFGRCVCLENGFIKLMATVDVGPRIIYFSTRGNRNILFEDINRDFYEMNKGYGIWYAYGGHRLWSAPEKMPETYYPDNHRVSYSFEDGVLTLSPRETLSGKQFTLTVEFVSDYAVRVRNTIQNVSETPQRFAPWSVTGFASGGTEFIPLNRTETGFLPNRTMALWSYSDVRDERFRLTDAYATLTHDENAGKAFKAGFNVTDGYVIYAAGNQRFKKTFSAYEDQDYPDFCCNFETYTNKHFLECELLGEERVYQPGEIAEINETWEITETSQTPEQEIASCIAACDA